MPREGIRAAPDPIPRDPNRASRPEGAHRCSWCCARRSTAWCCAATARSARSSDRPTCCSGSARRADAGRCRDQRGGNHRIAVGQKAFLRSEAFPDRRCTPPFRRSRRKATRPEKPFGSICCLPTIPVADRHVGRSQYHLPREAGRDRRADRSRVGNAVQIVNSGKIERVPITVGISGSRNVEIIGKVSNGIPVLSPARCRSCRRHAGPRRARNKQVAPRLPPMTAFGCTPAACSHCHKPPAAVVASSTDPDDAVISTAISAHVDSIVNDARRNVRRVQRGAVRWQPISLRASPGPTSPPASGKRWSACPASPWASASPS